MKLNSKELKYKLEKLNYEARNGRVSQGNLRKFNMLVVETNKQHNDTLWEEKQHKLSEEFKGKIERAAVQVARGIKRGDPYVKITP
jgi:hypothetical protein